MINTHNEKSFPWIPPLLIIYNFCANLANDIYLPSLPQLTHLFDTSSATLQLTMSAWFAGVASPQLFFGPLTDRFGRRPVLFGGGLCFLIATAICASASNVWVLIVARFFQGVGVCSLNVTTFGILIDLYSYKSRMHIVTRINMFGTLAPLIGPVIGGYILMCFNWRVNFVVIFFMGLISLVGLWFKLPESNLYLNPHALDIKNLYQNYFLLLKNRGFLRHLLPYCLMLGGLIVYLSSAPFIIIDELHIPPHLFGYTQLPIFSAYILGSLYLGKVNDEVMIKRLLQTGMMLVFIGGSLLILHSYFLENNLFGFIIPMIIYALGFSLCAGPLVNEVMSAATATKGSAAAFLGFGMAMSCMLSSLFLGLMYNGNIISIASLLFGITALASIYYLRPDTLSIQREQIR